MTLPPGLKAAEFADVCRQFADVVGKDWVFTSDEDVRLYRDAYSLFWDEPTERLASAAVAPSTVEDVQAIVRIANDHGVPIYPVSTGKNLGYGGSAPTLSGSVVLDLKRMNRVLDVSEANASCLVEPGVSYFDMYRHLQAGGHKLWIDCPDPGWGSLVGNALDNGGGYTAPMYRDHFAAHCGMEVVLPTGDLYRTGMGALPGAETWQQYKFGYGPMLDGLFKQSSLGVVTKMGFWLFPEPEAVMTGYVGVPRHDDIEPLVEIFNFLENSHIFNGLSGISSPFMPMMAPGGHLPEAPTPEAMEKMAADSGQPCWSSRLTFYGPPNVIRAQWEYAKEKFSVIPGATFTDGEIVKTPLTPEQINKIHKPVFGIPSLDMFSMGARSKFNMDPTEGHFWFSPIIPRTGKGYLEASRVIRQVLKDHDIPILVFSPPVGSWIRAFIVVIALPAYKDAENNQRLRKAVKELIRICAEHGWGEYRTAPAFQDTVMDAYSFNDHIHRRVNETIKDALDPNGIMSVGRYGVWPKRFREGRS